jgi:hypothetical protein
MVTPISSTGSRAIRLTTHVLGGSRELVVDQLEVAGSTATALVLPGFGRTADEYFHLSAFLLHHGVSVVVPDFRMHPGRSAGAVWDFTLSAQLEDVAALLDGFDVDGVLATSLSFPPTLRVLADRGWKGHLVGIVPVMSPADTLQVVTGRDWRLLEEPYPEGLKVTIDGFDVSPGLVTDTLRNEMAEAESTLADARRFAGTLAMVIGESDTWVQPAQVHRLAGEVRGSEVVSLGEVAHDFGRSVRRARAMFLAATDAFLRPKGLGSARSDIPLDTVIQARQELRESGSTTRLGSVG